MKYLIAMLTMISLMSGCSSDSVSDKPDQSPDNRVLLFRLWISEDGLSGLQWTGYDWGVETPAPETWPQGGTVLFIGNNLEGTVTYTFPLESMTEEQAEAMGEVNLPPDATTFEMVYWYERRHDRLFLMGWDMSEKTFWTKT